MNASPLIYLTDAVNARTSFVLIAYCVSLENLRGKKSRKMLAIAMFLFFLRTSKHTRYRRSRKVQSLFGTKLFLSQFPRYPSKAGRQGRKAHFCLFLSIPLRKRERERKAELSCARFILPPHLSISNAHTCIKEITQHHNRSTGDSGPTLSEFWSFKIHRTTFLNNIKLSNLLMPIL